MNKTSIEWCSHSSNVIYAVDIRNERKGHFCTPVSRGCTNCWANEVNHRFGNDIEYAAQNEKFIRFELNIPELKKLRDHRKPARVFIEDMSDIAHPMISDAMIAKALSYLLQCRPSVENLLLTKRIDRLADLLTNSDFIKAVFLEIYDEVPTDLFGDVTALREEIRFQWPPANLHIGTSIEDQKSLHARGPHLAKLAVAGFTTYYSLEPMVAPVNFEDTKNVYYKNYLRDPITDTPLCHGVICGGESGHGAFPLHPELPRTIRDACIRHRIPFMFKGWGHWMPVENTHNPAWQHGGPPKDWPWNQRDPRIENDPTEPWRYFALGKNKTGNTLDNRQHLHIPNRNCQNITQEQWLQTAKELAA